MKKRMMVVLLAGAMLTTTITGCSKKEDILEDVIKIGIFEPLTGANAAGGELELQGAELANELYPEVLGKKVVLVKSDNKSDKVESASAVARLIEKDGVVALIGSWSSSLSIAASDMVKNAQIPAVGASCTSPLVTMENDYYFRVCFLDSFQGAVMATYAYEKLGVRKVAVIQEVSSDYSVGLSKYFGDTLRALTGDQDCIVALSKYNTGDQDFTAQLANVKMKKPDAIFAPGNYTESALLIKQAKQLGIDIPFLGTDSWETPAFIEVGGKAVEGAIFSTFFDAQHPGNVEGERFVYEYKTRYNQAEPAGVTALAYDAYLVILDAIKRAGSADPVAIRDAIAQTKDFPGAAGLITLNAEGDAQKDAVIKIVKNGKSVYQDIVKKQ